MKRKAPEWLRLSFRDGVDERDTAQALQEIAYTGTACWLAQFDPLERPCAGPLERAHLISRQRVEEKVWALLYDGPIQEDFWDYILNAAWDPRNAKFGCGHEHHPRFDSKQTPTLIVPYAALPDHVHEFAEDYGLVAQLKEKFPQLDRLKEASPKCIPMKNLSPSTSPPVSNAKDAPSRQPA